MKYKRNILTRKSAPQTNSNLKQEINFKLNLNLLCIFFALQYKNELLNTGFLVPLMITKNRLNFILNLEEKNYVWNLQCIQNSKYSNIISNSRGDSDGARWVHCAEMNFLCIHSIYRMTYWYLDDEIQG